LLAVVNGVIFRQLLDASSSTYTFLLACPETYEAILIDPVYEQVGFCASEGTLLNNQGAILPTPWAVLHPAAECSLFLSLSKVAYYFVLAFTLAADPLHPHAW
jgi:hypothetical protein